MYTLRQKKMHTLGRNNSSVKTTKKKRQVFQPEINRTSEMPSLFNIIVILCGHGTVLAFNFKEKIQKVELS